MNQQSGELFAAIKQRLEFLGLMPGTKFVVLANTGCHSPTVDAVLGAGGALGTEPVLVIVPYRKPYTDIPPVAEETLKAADFVIDLQHLNWVYTASHNRVVADFMQRGAVYEFLGGVAEDVLYILNCPPTERLKNRALRAQQIIDRSTMIHVTTLHGTDLWVPRGDPKTLPAYLFQYGQVAFAPPIGTAEGTLMFQGVVRIQAPDPQTFHVFEPFRIEIAAGQITHIERKHNWAHFLADWFASFESPIAYQLAHINVGLDERASLVRIDNTSIHVRAGGVLTGFGINWTPLLGTPEQHGARNHVDMHLVTVNYFADEHQLVSQGKLNPALDSETAGS